MSDTTKITTFVSEDFSDASGNILPEGWSNEVLEGDPAVDEWRFDNPGDRTFPDFLTDPVAVFDSDAISNNDLAEDVALETPVFDASDASQVFLKLDQEYLGLIDPDYGSQGLIEVYDGSEWKTVSTQISDVIGTTRLDISEYAAGVEDAQVRFRWTGNWSYYWALDNVEISDALEPGVSLTGNPLVSESNVPDTRNFQFSLNSKPTSDVTFNFTVDPTQLQPIESLTFTPDNWNVPQIARVDAVADDIDEGENQKSTIQINIDSADPNYSNLKLKDAVATITDSTIPGFTSYRTVEKTFSDVSALATNNPNIASWIDIGDSYDKATPGGPEGYDIYALELTNKNINPDGGKPTLYVEGGIHSREYSTNEVASRFAEYLVGSYGIDSDATWLLDYFKVVVVPAVNPDGRKFAEQGYLWRKNTNPNPPEGYDAAEFPNYGVDLNRNHDFEWGEVPGGSSGDPNSETYRGASPASEPETQAIENYVRTLFPDQRGPEKTDPAPDDATGVFIDLHSYGNTVLYPWGSTSDPAPNKEGLRDLGLKFGYYTDANGTPYDVYQAIGLYPTDGTTDDWAYGTLGVPGYTWELGTDFFESSEYYEASINDQVISALTYAAKSAYRPYLTASAPETIDVTTNISQVVKGTIASVNLRATADDTRYADSNAEGLEEGTELPASQEIRAARYGIDAPSWVAGTKTYSLRAADGTLDSPTEELIAKIDTSGLSVGRHTIFVESRDTEGNFGVPTAVFIDVLPEIKDAQVLIGNSKDNTLIGSDDTDVIYGLNGADNLAGGLGEDVIIGGNGTDLIRGDQNNPGNADAAVGDSDILYGGNGADRIGGKGGDDSIYGEDGVDTLFGDDGDDLIWGGKGSDIETGGAGKDTFVLAYGEGRDTILDFELGKDLLGLAGTITYAQIDVSQGAAGAVVELGKQVLAQLSGISAADLTADAFVTVEPVA